MATPRLKDKYTKEIVPALKQKFEYSSVMQVPKIEKICINKGMGSSRGDHNDHWSESCINKIKEGDL